MQSQGTNPTSRTSNGVDASSPPPPPFDLSPAVHDKSKSSRDLPPASRKISSASKSPGHQDNAKSSVSFNARSTPTAAAAPVKAPTRAPSTSRAAQPARRSSESSDIEENMSPRLHRNSKSYKEGLPQNSGADTTKHLTTIEFDCSLAAFWAHLWQAPEFSVVYLEGLGDGDIEVSRWEKNDEERNGFDLERLVTSAHPMDIKFPGVPNTAVSYKRQRALLTRTQRGAPLLLLVENVTMIGSMPYSTYFTIQVSGAALCHALFLSNYHNIYGCKFIEWVDIACSLPLTMNFIYTLRVCATFVLFFFSPYLAFNKCLISVRALLHYKSFPSLLAHTLCTIWSDYLAGVRAQVGAFNGGAAHATRRLVDGCAEENSARRPRHRGYLF
jgi:hypothetical protein